MPAANGNEVPVPIESHWEGPLQAGRRDPSAFLCVTLTSSPDSQSQNQKRGKTALRMAHGTVLWAEPVSLARIPSLPFLHKQEAGKPVSQAVYPEGRGNGFGDQLQK